jgi:hypothetical protein
MVAYLASLKKQQPPPEAPAADISSTTQEGPSRRLQQLRKMSISAIRRNACPVREHAMHCRRVQGPANTCNAVTAAETHSVCKAQQANQPTWLASCGAAAST